MLTPFSVKDGMTLASPSRLPLQDTSDFDHLVENQDSTLDYLQTCRSKFEKNNALPRSELVTMAMDIDGDSCQAWNCIPNEKKPKFKLIQFHENHRPAYYGSWTKPRGHINPRNPFKMDSVSKGLWCVCTCMHMCVHDMTIRMVVQTMYFVCNRCSFFFYDV